MLAAVSRSAASLLRAGAPKAQQVIPALQAISKYNSQYISTFMCLKEFFSFIFRAKKNVELAE